MISEINGDAVQYTLNGDKRIMLHVTNNKGVMGAGIAKQVKEAFPDSYSSYKESTLELGTVSGWFTPFLNLTAQDGYGRDGKRYLNYGALAECLLEVRSELNSCYEIVIPKYMGCGLAGGDWEIVFEIIEQILGCFCKVTIVEY